MKRVNLLALLSGCKEQPNILSKVELKYEMLQNQLDIRKEYVDMLEDNVVALRMINATIEMNTDALLSLMQMQKGIIVKSMTKDDFNTSIDKIAELVVEKILAAPTEAVAYGEPVDYNAFTDYGVEFFYGETK